MSAPRKRPNRQFARPFVEAIAHLHTVPELAAMEWPKYGGGTTRFHLRTIANWLNASGIKAKPVIRTNQLSDASRREILRRYHNGEATTELAKLRWEMKGGASRVVGRTTIYDLCVRRRSEDRISRPMSDREFNAQMLGFPLE